MSFEEELTPVESHVAPTTSTKRKVRICVCVCCVLLLLAAVYGVFQFRAVNCNIVGAIPCEIAFATCKSKMPSPQPTEHRHPPSTPAAGACVCYKEYFRCMSSNRCRYSSSGYTDAFIVAVSECENVLCCSSEVNNSCMLFFPLWRPCIIF